MKNSVIDKSPLKFKSPQTMINIRTIVILFLIGLLYYSCATKEEKQPNIIRLDKLTKVRFSGINHHLLSEVLIIENHPKDSVVLDSLINDYIKTKSLLVSYDSIYFKNHNVIKYYICFFKSTRCTKYYIENRQDKNHEIYGDGSGRNRDCSKDCLGFYTYYRSEDDSTMWYSNYPKERKDTIYINTIERH